MVWDDLNLAPAPPVPRPLHTPPRPADAEAVSRNRDAGSKPPPNGTTQELVKFVHTTLRDVKHRPLLDAVFGNSPFLTQCLIAEPAVLRAFLADGPDATFAELVTELRADDSAGDSEAALMRRLRIGKRRASLLVGLADIAGLWPLDSVTGALSLFADATPYRCTAPICCGRARRAAIRLPHPGDPVGAFGSGGARAWASWAPCELNYSSDIDLIFALRRREARLSAAATVKQELRSSPWPAIWCASSRSAPPTATSSARPAPAARSRLDAAGRLGAAAETYYEALGQNWERAA